jgi:hypothetical protein
MSNLLHIHVVREQVAERERAARARNQRQLVVASLLGRRGDATPTVRRPA